MDSEKETAAWGRVRISLTPGQEAGWCYYSEAIRHGLPDGLFTVTCALEQPDGGRIYGSSSPFADTDFTAPALQAEVGALLSPDRRTLRIGLKLLADTEETEASVFWQARSLAREEARRSMDPEEESLLKLYYQRKEEKSVRNGTDAEDDASLKDFYIISVPQYLYRGRKFMFTCHLPDGETGKVHWKVLSENGGSIDEYGMYTAPDHQGVFQVEASLGEQARYKTTVYVMVKE